VAFVLLEGKKSGSSCCNLPLSSSLADGSPWNRIHVSGRRSCGGVGGRRRGSVTVPSSVIFLFLFVSSVTELPGRSSRNNWYPLPAAAAGEFRQRSTEGEQGEATTPLFR
jgi:hypothetical protein